MFGQYRKAIGGFIGALLAAAVAYGVISEEQAQTLGDAIMSILLIALGGGAGAFIPKNDA